MSVNRFLWYNPVLCHIQADISEFKLMCANTATAGLPQESMLLAMSLTPGSHYAHLIKNLCGILTSRITCHWLKLLCSLISTEPVLLRIIINSNQLNMWCLMHCTDGFLNCLERWLNGYLAAKCFPQKKSSKTRDTGH